MFLHLRSGGVKRSTPPLPQMAHWPTGEMILRSSRHYLNYGRSRTPCILSEWLSEWYESPIPYPHPDRSWTELGELPLPCKTRKLQSA